VRKKIEEGDKMSSANGEPVEFKARSEKRELAERNEKGDRA